MHEESVFSFKLYKQYIDCFSSMCNLIPKAESNFLDGRKKYCGIGKWWSENHTYSEMVYGRFAYKSYVLGQFPNCFHLISG